MKRKLLPMLLLAALCLGLLAGCGSSQSATGVMNNQAETTKLEAPTPYTGPGNEPDSDGYYYHSFELYFDGTAYDSGKLYVLIDRGEIPEEALSLDADELNGIFIEEYPSDHPFAIPFISSGSHTVQAFVGDGDTVASEVFEDTYNFWEYGFDDFVFSWLPGQYMAPIPLSFKDTYGGKLYYTLDGSDPLSFDAYNEYGLDWSGAIRLSDEKVIIPRGKTTITARYVDAYGFISPIITGVFEISKPFDTASRYVDEDFEFDYVKDPEHGIRLYDKATGDYTQALTKYKIARFFAMPVTYRPDLEHSDTMIPQAIVEVQEKKHVITVLYFLTPNSEQNSVYFLNGSLYGDVNYAVTAKNIERVGVGWYRMTNHDGSVDIKWRSSEYETGTKDLAKKAILMLDETALYTVFKDGSYAVMSCNLEGEDEQVLWTDDTTCPILDAMTDKIILYHTGDDENAIHMIYDRATGEHRENTTIPVSDDTHLLGYTSDAAYVQVYMGIKRIVMDYDAL